MRKDNIIKRILEFIKNIFAKKNETKYITTGNLQNENDTRRTFKGGLQEFNNSEALIEKVSKNTSILYNMSLIEIKQLNKAIQKKQESLNQNIMELRMQIANFN